MSFLCRQSSGEAAGPRLQRCGTPAQRPQHSAAHRSHQQPRGLCQAARHQRKTVTMMVVVVVVVALVLVVLAVVVV